MNGFHRLILILFIFCLGSLCFADGMFKGPGAAVPGIPYQAGIIRYKDGVETLIIQSYMEAEEGENFGWIIPLPREPKKLEPFSSGAFNTLPFCFTPEINKNSFWIFIYPIMFFLIVNIYILRSKKYSLIRCIVLFFISIISSIIIVPKFPNVQNKKPRIPVQESFSVWISGIKILQSSHLDSFKFDILKANDPGALNEWLEINGLHVLEEKEKKVVNDYINEEWVFAVVQLTREAGGSISSPHPISFTFESEKPVYPMRLTGLASKLPDLYLYVIADQKTKINGFKTMFSDELFFIPSEKIWSARNYIECMIGHKAILPLFWHGCNLTALHSVIKPDIAVKDLYIQFEKPSPERYTLYSSNAAISRAFFYPFVVLSFLLVLFHISWRIVNRFRMTKLNMHLSIYVVYLLLIIVSFFLIRDSFPTANNMGMKDFIYTDKYYPISWQIHDVPELLLKYKIDLTSISKEDLTQFIMNNENLNKRWGSTAKIINEDSPGNFTLDKNEKGEWILTVYDLLGIAHDSNLTGYCKIQENLSKPSQN